MAAPDFVVHNGVDTVGVVVVEDVSAGHELSGWAMETDRTVGVKALDRIPLGHKIALAHIREGDPVIKYGHDIGRAVADIERGAHVHVHNLKTRRW